MLRRSKISTSKGLISASLRLLETFYSFRRIVQTCKALVLVVMRGRVGSLIDGYVSLFLQINSYRDQEYR